MNTLGKHRSVFHGIQHPRVKARSHKEPQPLFGSLQGWGERESLGAQHSGAAPRLAMVMLLQLVEEHAAVS